MFGDKLKARREEKGLSQDDVADFFGQAVSKWERGGGYWWYQCDTPDCRYST